MTHAPSVWLVVLWAMSGKQRNRNMIMQIAGISVLKIACPSVCGSKSSASGTERTVASKRR